MPAHEAIQPRRALMACLPWIAALFVAGERVPAARADVLYATGFEQPTFTAGPLGSQGGFSDTTAGPGDTFQITTSNPYSGSQALEAVGANLPISQGFGSATAAIALNYDTAAAGTPIVVIEARVMLVGPSTAAGGPPNDDLASINLEALTGDFNPNTFVGYYSTYLSSDERAIGFTTGYGPNTAATITLGTYHDVSLTLNFADRTSTFAVDGTTFGSVGFDPTEASTVLSSAQISFYSNSIPGVIDPADYTAYVDNFTVTAVPEPSSIALVSAGSLALLAARRRAANRPRSPGEGT